jgi:hypothetical protein
MEPTAFKEFKESKEFKAFRVSKEFKAIREIRGTKEIKEIPVRRESLFFPDFSNPLRKQKAVRLLQPMYKS